MTLLYSYSLVEVACLSDFFYQLTHWYFVIETICFHLKIFSKVDKIIYNSFLDACLIIFVPKTPVEFLTKYIVQTS